MSRPAALGTAPGSAGKRCPNQSRHPCLAQSPWPSAHLHTCTHAGTHTGSKQAQQRERGGGWVIGGGQWRLAGTALRCWIPLVEGEGAEVREGDPQLNNVQCLHWRKRGCSTRMQHSCAKAQRRAVALTEDDNCCRCTDEGAVHSAAQQQVYRRIPALIREVVLLLRVGAITGGGRHHRCRFTAASPTAWTLCQMAAAVGGPLCSARLQ